MPNYIVVRRGANGEVYSIPDSEGYVGVFKDKRIADFERMYYQHNYKEELEVFETKKGDNKMDILRGDVAITENTLKELFKIYSEKLEGEITSNIYDYDTDCPSYIKVQSIVDTLVTITDFACENGLDKH